MTDHTSNDDRREEGASRESDGPLAGDARDSPSLPLAGTRPRDDVSAAERPGGGRPTTPGTAVGTPVGEGCACAEHLDAEFDCRASEGTCPRLGWLQAFPDRAPDEPAADPVDRGRDELQRMATALGLAPDVAETAVQLFDHAREQEFLPGRRVESVASAALYAAARQAGVPRTLDEVAAVSRVSRGDVGQAARRLVEALDLAVVPPSPLDYLPRFADRLDLDAETERVARSVLTAVEVSGVQAGRHPASLVAAGIYLGGLLAGNRVQQARVSEATGVGASTISELYHELLEDLSLADEPS